MEYSAPASLLPPVSGCFGLQQGYEPISPPFAGLRRTLQGQEEALGLSVQLSDARQQVGTLAAALEQARQHLEAQQTALTQASGGKADVGMGALHAWVTC